MRVPIIASLLLSVSSALAQKIVLANDDGWAIAQIRAQWEALHAANFDVTSKNFLPRSFWVYLCKNRLFCLLLQKISQELAHARALQDLGLIPVSLTAVQLTLPLQVSTQVIVRLILFYNVVKNIEPILV